MKYLKYIAVVLLVLAILALTLHFYRETIVLRFANSMLANQGIVVTELSIETLRPDFVNLSHIVLQQDDGTRFDISGLSFPLSLPSVNVDEIIIDEIVLAPGNETSAPLPLARMLQVFLQLPVGMKSIRVTIGEMRRPDGLAVDDIVWESRSGGQQLAFRANPIALRIHIESTNDGQHQASISADAGSITDALSLTLTIHRNDGGFSIEGTSAMSLSPWLPVFQSVGLIPGDVVALAATLEGNVSFELYDDASQPASADMQLVPGDDLTAEFLLTDGRVRLRAKTLTPVRLHAAYPSLEWTASLDQLDATVATNERDKIPLSLSGLVCRSGITCSSRVGLDTGPLALEPATIENVHLTSSLSLAIDDSIRMEVLPDLTLQLGAIDATNYSVASIQVKQFSGAKFVFDESGWRGDADQLTLVFHTLTDREGRTATSPVQLSKIGIRGGGAIVSAHVSIRPGAAAVSWNDTRIVAPGLTGDILLNGGQLRASLAVADGAGAVSGQLETSYEMASGKGNVTLRDAVLNFDRGGLSSHLLKWPYAWDIVSGTWSAAAGLRWQTTDSGIDYEGTITQQATALAGNYQDIVFAGLSTGSSAQFDSTAGPALSPSNIELALLEFGVPVEKIAADYEINLADQAVLVKNVSMSLLGGQLTVDPFRLALQEEQHNIVLRPRSIQLQFMLDLAEFEDVQIIGSISGVIPVTIRGKTITITDGRLESDPPGGVIHYRPGIDAGDATLDLVSRALANFRFDSLTSDINYTETGDLKQKMRLSGVNPDIDDRQPIILNLTVENNIPSMLRSLQATRSIEEILERRTMN